MVDRAFDACDVDGDGEVGVGGADPAWQLHVIGAAGELCRAIAPP